jgi:CBS domain-containing protein
MRVDDVMKPAKACREGTTVRDCARMMKERNIGFVPVCSDAGEPIGTITDRDLAIRVLGEGRSGDTRIEDVMTRDAVGCRLGDDIGKAALLMRERHKSRVMVCDPGGRLVGVISLSDIVDRQDEETAAETLREVAARENRQPFAS